MQAVLYPTEQPPKHTLVDFNILLSTTYRVPVLYFRLRNLPVRGPQGLDAVYQILVPRDAEAALRGSGVMGGISMAVSSNANMPQRHNNKHQNHPVTGMPWYFIHPCNTAKAMEDIIGTRQISELEYLLIWIGLIGGAVGLYLPKELAMIT